MALPYHIYVVSSKIPQNEYTERVQYGTAFVFLVLVMLIAMASIVLRDSARNRYMVTFWTMPDATPEAAVVRAIWLRHPPMARSRWSTCAM